MTFPENPLHKSFFIKAGHMTEILNSKWGIYLITAVLFIGISLILRFLFGPKGKFREPYWDISNEKIRKHEQEEKEKNAAAE